MKQILLSFALLMLAQLSIAQNDSTATMSDTNLYRIVKTDGDELIGYILSEDKREILLRTSEGREIYVPQHVIEEVILLDSNDFNMNGDYVGEDRFATRYFITTNGLPIKKGEHYIQWNLFGPDFQFGLGKNFGVGVMTSWIGMPVIGTIKKSWELGDKTQFAIGGLVGTGTWIAPDWGGALPFGTLSFGSRKANIAFSGGYGAVWFGNGAEGRAITSVAGMVKVGPRVSLVFDSFILPPGPRRTETYTTYNEVYDPNTGQWVGQTETITYETRSRGFSLLIPGVRVALNSRTAFQVGFSGVINDGDLLPVPIPMFQLYQSLK